MTTITVEIRKKSLLKTVITFLEALKLPFQVKDEAVVSVRPIPPLEDLVKDLERYKNGDKEGFLEFNSADDARKYFGL